MHILALSALIASMAVAAPTPPSNFAHEFEGLKPILALQNGEDALKLYEILELLLSAEYMGSISEQKAVISKIQEISKTMKNIDAFKVAYITYSEDLNKRLNSMNSEAKLFIRKHSEATMKAITEAVNAEIRNTEPDFVNLSDEAIASMKAAFPATNEFFVRTRVAEEKHAKARWIWTDVPYGEDEM